MFGDLLNFHSETFKKGTLLVRGIAYIAGEYPPLTETVHRVFTLDYLERQKAIFTSVGISTIPEHFLQQPFSLDNVATLIMDEDIELTGILDAFSHWGSMTGSIWYDEVDEGSIQTLAQHSYEGIGVVFFYRSAISLVLGNIHYLEYQELG